MSINLVKKRNVHRFLTTCAIETVVDVKKLSDIRTHNLVCVNIFKKENLGHVTKMMKSRDSEVI